MPSTIVDTNINLHFHPKPLPTLQNRIEGENYFVQSTVQQKCSNQHWTRIPKDTRQGIPQGQCVTQDLQLQHSKDQL